MVLVAIALAEHLLRSVEEVQNLKWSTSELLTMPTIKVRADTVPSSLLSGTLA